MVKSNFKPETNEERFLNALKDVFIGAKIEGEPKSGYINLMRIKSKYSDKILKILKKEIDEKTKGNENFKQELYDKLYTFFYKYFSESGSIYFRETPFKERIYERVYDNNKDVAMFWKTWMLYYVKTDIQPKNMKFEINGIEFSFDVSKLQPKKANEKKELIYQLKEAKDKKISFYVFYSEKGRKTKVEEILKELTKKKIKIDEETLEKAFRVFEKQNQVDYFINKNAKKFLKEQFDLWFYQYVYSDETRFTEERIKQLKLIKEFAYKIIDYISQFEDELVKIWEKPKFVLNSNYVITLGRIAKKKDGMKVIEKIVKELTKQNDKFKKEVRKLKELKSKKKSYRERFESFEINNQLTEWFLLDMIDENFNQKKIMITNLKGKDLNPKFKFLPIDTKYFKNLEIEILSLFDNLDDELDGRLIKSDNWQALNTILKKFKEQVQTIYIDPPFNTGSNEFTMYINKFLDSAWITMMENRLRLAKDFLKDTGSIFVRIDYHGNHYVKFLMNDIFGKENFRNEIIISRTRAKQPVENQFIQQTESLLFYSKSKNLLLNEIERPRNPEWHPLLHFPRADTTPRVILGKVFYPPKGRRWALSQERIKKFEKVGKIRINKELNYVDCRGKKVKGVPELLYDMEIIGNEWVDIPGYSQSQHFPTENSEILLKRVIKSTSNKGDLVMDFFLGSGTTTAVAHKLGRKWIGVEMGNHFYTIVIPRMKRVLFYDKSGISKEDDVKKIYNEKNAGGFFKYYELEQYEDVLRRVKYTEAEPLFDPNEDPYNQYIFMRDPKMLEILKVDLKKNKVKVDLSKLYKNIDVVETLSNLLGMKIKRISKNKVEFEDGTVADTNDLNYKLIKNLVWW